MSVPFAIVDVFSTTAFKGNPLAVVNNMADTLTDTQMKLLTRQFNLSETTFFMPPIIPGANYRLRSFLPDGKEVYGAGHNILGVWWYLAHSGLLDLSEPLAVDSSGTEEFVFRQELGGKLMPLKVLKSKDGALSVSIRQVPPQAHNVHPDRAALATSVGLGADDIGLGAESNLRPQVMSTSTTRHLIVPLASVAALDSVSVQRERILEQLALVDDKAYGLFLFTRDPSSPDTAGRATFQARFFSPGMSAEDPATGSAAGPLSVYLQKHGYVPLVDGTAQIVVRQGLRVGRECVINVAISQNKPGDDVLEVDIIGGGVEVGAGQMAIPNSATVF